MSRSEPSQPIIFLAAIAVIGIGAAAALGCFASVALAFSAKEHPPDLAARAPDLRLEQWLSAQIEQQKLGFSMEPPEQQAFLEQRARDFAGFIHRGPGQKIPPADIACDAPSGHQYNDPFCPLVQEADDLGFWSRPHHWSRPRTFARHGLKLVRRWLAQADIEKLHDVSERELGNALRTFGDFAPLEPVAKALQDSPACRFPSLDFLLAMRAEDFLPDEASREQAIQLYKTASECDDSEVRTGSLYRYSLLEVWAGRCPAAMPALTELALTRSRDYRSRALYWKAQCGYLIGGESKAAADEAKKELVSEFPFDLHSLLIQRDNPRRLEAFLSARDSIVRYRSLDKPELNGRVTAAEALLSIGEDGLAKKLLTSINAEADGAEPEFQLYLAWLYGYVGDTADKLHTLLVCFRDHPEAISREALELYYPRKSLDPEAIQEAGVNELVVMALIRQESAFNARARSPAGAMGLMQVLPRTARLVEHTRRRPNLYDPANNIRIGSKYFSDLLRHYGGDTELALAAYNAGSNRVDDWVKRYDGRQRLLFLDLLPFRETREYVASIARNYFWYSVLYSAPPGGHEPPAKLDLTQAMAPGIEGVFKSFGT